jgi:hypothetical protein
MAQVCALLPARQQRAIANLGLLMLKHTAAYMGQETVYLGDVDKLRILRWLSWSARLSMPIPWILATVFEWGNGVAGARIKYRRRKNLFPMTIAVLTGDACFEFVQAQAELSRKGDSDATESLRSTMLSDTAATTNLGTVQAVLHYSNVDDFADAYASRMYEARKSKATAELALHKTKPFRGNPFR